MLPSREVTVRIGPILDNPNLQEDLVVLRNLLRSSTAFNRAERGATSVEYGLIAAVIALGILGSVAAVRDSMINTYSAVASQLTTAAAPSTPVTPSVFRFAQTTFSVSSSPAISAADLFAGAAGPVTCAMEPSQNPSAILVNLNYMVSFLDPTFIWTDIFGSSDQIIIRPTSQGCEIELYYVPMGAGQGTWSPIMTITASDGTNTISGDVTFTP